MFHLLRNALLMTIVTYVGLSYDVSTVSLFAQEVQPETESAEQTVENEQTEEYKAVTSVDPGVPIDQLEIMVRPLSKSELEGEAKAWFELLRDKAKQIAATRLGVKKTSEAMTAEDAGQARDSLQAAADAIEVADQAVSSDASAEENSESDPDSEAATQTDPDPNADESAAAPDTADASDPTEDTREETPAPTKINPIAADSPEAVNEVREDLLEVVNTLQSERTGLSDRLEVVLTSLELKGGEVQEYRDYITAVSGIELDTTDVTSAWSGIVGWLRSKEGGQRWAWNLVRFFAILFVTGFLAKLIASIVNWLLERKVHLSKLAETLIARMVKYVVWAIGFAVALTALEIDVTPLVAAIGATGLVVGLALQGTLSNFASGLMILINRPFDIGDVVTAGGVTGTVDQMNLVSTRFRTFDNQTIYVPNNEIWNNVITNITANENRRVDLEFGIGYDDDFEQAESIISEVLSEHDMVLDDPAPAVVTHALADSSVNIVCRPWAKTSDWWQVKTDVTRAVKKRFDEAGISIPYPQQDIHVHQVPYLQSPDNSSA